MRQSALYATMVSGAIAIIADPKQWIALPPGVTVNNPIPYWEEGGGPRCFHWALVRAAYLSSGDAAAALQLAANIRDRIQELTHRDPMKVNDNEGREAVIAFARTVIPMF